MRNRIIIWILLLSVFAACGGPKVFFKHGDYYNAALASIHKLRKKPSNEKMQSMLKDSYDTFVKSALARVKDIQTDPKEDAWQQIYEYFREIQDLNTAIQGLPAMRTASGSTFTIVVTDVTKELQDVKKKAAEVLYARAEKKMEEANKRAYREAYNLYLDTYHIFPTYREDLKSKMDKSRLLGTDWVQFEIVNPNKEINVDWDKGGLNQYVTNHINRINANNPFLAYAGMNTDRNADLKLVFEVSSWSVMPAMREVVDVFTKKVVKTINVTKDASGNIIKQDTVWEDINGRASRKERTITANAVFTFKFIDLAGGNILQSREHSALQMEKVVTYRFVDGDSRAFPDDVAKAIKLSDEPPLPSPQFLFEQIMKLKATSDGQNMYDRWTKFLGMALY